MSFYQDKQVRAYGSFLIAFSVLILGVGFLLSALWANAAKEMYLAHDEAVAASLLGQGVSRDVIAAALTNDKASAAGKALLAEAGISGAANAKLLFPARFRRFSNCAVIIAGVCLVAVLFAGTLLFFQRRKQLYTQAESVLNRYLSGDYSCHLPQNQEGAVFRLFTLVEQLATMLQSKSETEHRAREFLKNTISDISHQLKTPLAALAMYQEIIGGEPENADAVKQFSAKMEISLKRMEQLILSMQKITRLDAGTIVFEKKCYSLAEVIAHSIRELTTRAASEGKQIFIDGDEKQMLVCDLEWTGEAVGNIVKNALDHTKPGGLIRISWEHTPIMLRIFISDNGEGIAPEDIHHIFKRFYRSAGALDTQGIGLGLPLAKSIIEGQGGMIAVSSEPNEGTVFTLSFLTEV